MLGCRGLEPGALGALGWLWTSSLGNGVTGRRVGRGRGGAGREAGNGMDPFAGLGPSLQTPHPLSPALPPDPCLAEQV